MKKFILFIALSLIYTGYSQKGTFTIGGGSSLMVSDLAATDDVEGKWSCCNKTSLKGITYFDYKSNYQSKFLMFSSPDVDIMPTIEVTYNALDKFRLNSSIFGFKRRTKFKAGRFVYFDHPENYNVIFYEKAIRLGLLLGVEYKIMDISNNHKLFLGVTTSFDKVVHRDILDDHGNFGDSFSNKSDFKASERFPPFTGINYILFSSLTYEYKVCKNWSIKSKLRYSPKLKFTRNYYFGRDTGLRMIYDSILAFDLQLVYRFGGK
ncbi:MAG: hypothetical protein WEA99_05020 [Brumimicrobium sp.]